jgi:mono/diheme cytochrome c family protein
VKKSKYIFLFLLSLVVFVIVGCGTGENQDPPPDQEEPVTTPIDAATLVENRCAECHNLERVYRKRDKELWPDIVTTMVKKSPGLLTNEEIQLVEEYLQDNYSK